MSDTNTQSECKKKCLSDNNGIISDYQEYIISKKDEIKSKISHLPNPRDYPFSMNDGMLFQKFSIEYLKNILFKNKNNNYKFSENKNFNFFEYVKLFTECEHSEKQYKLFNEIISLKNQKAESKEYMYNGDFDVIIDSIPGKDIKYAIENFQYSIYLYPGKQIQDNTNYCLIGEIKKDFYKEIKNKEAKKQFIKYSKILELLSAQPNLIQIKKKIGLNGTNNLLFCLITNGNYYNFDYNRYIRKKFQEDIHTDEDSEKLPDYFKIFNLICTSIPVLLIFVPKTLDDNEGQYLSKVEQNIILELKKEIRSIKDSQKIKEQEFEEKLKEFEKKIQKEYAEKQKEFEKKIQKQYGEKQKKWEDEVHKEYDEKQEEFEKKIQENMEEKIQKKYDKQQEQQKGLKKNVSHILGRKINRNEKNYEKENKKKERKKGKIKERKESKNMKKEK